MLRKIILFRERMHNTKNFGDKNTEVRKNYCSPQLHIFISAVSRSWRLGRRDLRSSSTDLRADRSDSSGGWSSSNSVGTGSISLPVSKLPGQKYE